MEDAVFNLAFISALRALPVMQIVWSGEVIVPVAVLPRTSSSHKFVWGKTVALFSYVFRLPEWGCVRC